MAHKGALPPLVKAKLSPPRVGDACLRPERLELLERSFRCRLTLVCAPAGYGKTTAVLEATRRLGLRFIWYKLDVLDHDPAVLIASLVQAFAGRYPGFGQTIIDRLANAHDAPYPIDQMVAEFVAEAADATTDDLWLVLDDYHEASDSRSLNTTLDYLVTNLPPTMRFVVLSRYEPALEVGKLRLNGDLATVGVEGLRFGPDEVLEVVMRRTDATLSPNHAAAIAELTEGWPASVVLAALATRWVGIESLESALSDPRLEQDVFSYLAEQVYSRESDEVRAFLRRTCCLEHLSVDFAKRVGAPRRAHRILSHLRSNGVFTFATAEEGTYRYHSLFREFLRRKAIQEDGPDRFHALQLATAKALEEHGDAERAVELCLAANEPRCALGVVSRVGVTDLDAFRSDTLESWTARLPDELKRCEPWAHLIAGEADMRAGSFDAALQHIDHAAAAFETDGDESGVYRALSARERTLFWKGDMTEAAKTCRQALGVTHDVAQRVHTLISLSAALNAECRWPEAARALEEARGLADGSLPGEQARLAAFTVFIAHNTGRYVASAEAAGAVANIVSKHGSPSLTMAFLNLASANHFFMAEWELARRDLHAAQELGKRYGFAVLLALADDAEAQLHSYTGDVARAAELHLRAIDAPVVADDPYCLSMAICHAGTAERRRGNHREALTHYVRAAGIARGTSARNAFLNVSANLAYTRGLGGERVREQLADVAKAARELDLLFVTWKAEFFDALLAYRAGMRGQAIEALRRCVPEQLKLGHLNFLAQELVLEPDVAADLLSATKDGDTIVSLLDVIARHPRSLPLLIASLNLGALQGAAATRAAVAHRTDAETASVLAKASRSPHKEVRDVAAEHRRSQRGEGNATASGFCGLTRREAQILGMIAEGASNQDIADRLVLSPATVKTHINHIFSKLGVRDRLQAALAYRRVAGKVSKDDAAAHD